MKHQYVVICMLGGALLAAGGCGDDGAASSGGPTGNEHRPDETGAICEVAEDCYPGVADGDLLGDALCMDRVRGGYCTHTCEQDEDCCAAEGECKTDLPQVCSPFESTGMNMCFLSCEAETVAQTDAADDNEFCQRHVHPAFICRSSGGGASNRKICMPSECGLGSACDKDDQCSDGLTCLTDGAGGYCTRTGCSKNDDCPGDSVCVAGANDRTFCAKRCSRSSDCTLCRGETSAARCRDDATFVEDGTSAAVCLPD